MTFTDNARRGFNLTLKESYKETVNVSGCWDDGRLRIVTTEQQRTLGIFRNFQDKVFVVTTKPV